MTQPWLVPNRCNLWARRETLRRPNSFSINIDRPWGIASPRYVSMNHVTLGRHRRPWDHGPLTRYAKLRAAHAQGMSGKSGWRGNVPGIPGACATRNFAYLVRGPFYKDEIELILPKFCKSNVLVMWNILIKFCTWHNSWAENKTHFARYLNYELINRLWIGPKSKVQYNMRPILLTY